MHKKNISQKGFVNIILVVVAVVAILSVAGHFVAVQNNILPLYSPILNPNYNPIKKPVACTQEAKQCSDGSYVSRTGPNCEFAKCPDIQPTPQPGQVILKEGQREGSLLVQKIYTDYITGLNFPEYPVAYMNGYPITLRIGEMASNGCTVTMTLISIQEDSATFIKKITNNQICPICLAGDTLIDTPLGTIPVKDLKIGDQIWTADLLGRRVAGTVQKVSKTPVLPTHQMVHLILGDGREIFASPGHPTVDGRTVGDLLPGDSYDNSFIKTAARVLYNQDFTYDVLPSDKTGFYWANGILLGSTLDK